ncbi:MAG: Npt1/Npt2 family nucleotide transporter, partial [Myxococcota bacterium]
MPFVRRVIDLRPGEGSLVARVFGLLFALVAAHTVLETARDALFLRALPASRLTLVYIGLAVLGAVVPFYNGRLMSLFGRRTALVFTLMLAAMGTTLIYLQPLVGWQVYGLYMWSALLGTLLVIQFWLVAAQVFTVAQGKRLFAGLASGGVLGAVAGGGLASALLELLPHGDSGVHPLLALAVAILLVAALLATTIPSDEVALAAQPRARPPLREAFGVLHEQPFVLRLSVVLSVSTAVLLLTDFTFKSVAKAELSGAELGPFFARYYAVLNSVALVVQLLIAQRVVQRFGVVFALLTLPLL